MVDIILREGLPRGLILSTAATVSAPSKPKTLVWSPRNPNLEAGLAEDIISEEQEHDPLQRGIPRSSTDEGIIVLGAPVGNDRYVCQSLETKVEKVRQITELLPLLQDPHIEHSLLRSCLALPKITFLLRAVDTSRFPSVLERFDEVTRDALSRILGTPVSDVRAILILTFFRNHYFACSQVLPLASRFSKLFLFLLYDLSFPCRYFFSASMGISMGK